MTERKDALTELLAKVEVGSITQGSKKAKWPDFDFEGKGYGYKVNANMALAYNGDLNAAKALHEAVLPDHRARLDVGNKYRAWIITPDNEKFDAYSTNPARAWLIAILKALISGVTLDDAALGARV
jgi:hypothetical protein